MTKDRLCRVIWRVKEMIQEKGSSEEKEVCSNHQLDTAIGEECGTCDRTLRDTKKQLRKHRLIASEGLGLWKIYPAENSNYGHAPQEEERQDTLGTNSRVPAACVPPEPETALSIPRRNRIDKEELLKTAFSNPRDFSTSQDDDEDELMNSE